MIMFLVKLICYIPYRLIFWTRWVNKKKLKPVKGKGVIIVCNHRNGLDGPTWFMVFNRRFHLWVKEEFFKSRFWRFVWGQVRGIPVKSGSSLSLIRSSLEVLNKKEVLLVFPQGHRTFNTAEELQVRSGAAMVALRSGAPIVPVVTDRKIKPFRLTKLKIGDPIDTAEFLDGEGKANMEKLSLVIKDRMTEMLNGFEKQERLKKWQKEPSIIARGIVIHEEKLLVIKRVKEGQTYFVIPGGHVESGETARQACEREVAEETGVTVSAYRELYKYYFADPHLRGNGYQSFFVCDFKSGEVHKTDAEEYTSATRVTGTYEPMFLPMSELKNIDLRPSCIKKRLLRGYHKKGARLAYPLRLIKSDW